MDKQIILRFLNAGLVDVGADDTKLEKLRKTSVDLANALHKAPPKAVSFALIAFDPAATDEDPVIKEAVEALQKHWPTHRNTFSETPVTVLRAVLLEALVLAAREDDNIGVALTSLARNSMPFMEAANEQAIWEDVVTALELRVNARAEREWGDSAEKAGAAGSSLQGAPNFSASATEFGRQLGVVITEAGDAEVEGLVIEPARFSGPLTAFAREVLDQVGGLLEEVKRASAVQQRRTSLLWWKEALYSPSLRISYRAMPASAAAALMAFDLNRHLPTFSPASVAAFLSEAVLSLPSLAEAQARSIQDLVTEASNSVELTSFRKVALELAVEAPGRGPILGLIGHGYGRVPLDDRAFRMRVGVSASTLLTLPEWAQWIFRELQAARAVQASVELKKRGRKA